MRHHRRRAESAGEDESQVRGYPGNRSWELAARSVINWVEAEVEGDPRAVAAYPGLLAEFRARYGNKR